MSAVYEISDDESFNINNLTEDKTVVISSDEDATDDINISNPETRHRNKINSTEMISIASDSGSGPSLKLKDKEVKEELQSSLETVPLNTKNQGWEDQSYPIGGVEVHMPFKPNRCQIELIYKIITAINRKLNCLLESPTGTGKTLALLCGALAWQLSEQNRLAQIQAQQCMTNNPELIEIEGASKYIASPKKNNITPEKLFNKTHFGERNIYDKPTQNSGGDVINPGTKRFLLFEDNPKDKPSDGQVRIHKKRCIDNTMGESSKVESHEVPLDNNSDTQDEAGTPSKQRKLCELIENLQLRTSMIVDSSLPKIYYGARTHKQIEQVIKELKSTRYCEQVTMSVLSSREHSCIREHDKKLWTSKDDMCRGCIKGVKLNEERSNCKYYDNRKALNHNSLPDAFDLEDLVTAGMEKSACPYYAARAMAKYAQIIFCPYNYLIDTSIRSSMQIDLTDNIVIIDEAHNIEDICRNSATYVITDKQIKSALTELERAAEFKFANSTQEGLHYIDYLIKTVKNWDDWFVNQMALVRNKPVNNMEAVHVWEMPYFLQTLDNHNIGHKQFNEFKRNAELFYRQWRDDPKMLYGVTQSTITLLEALKTVFGYIFREDKKYIDDFVPTLIRNLSMKENACNSANNWRHSQFNKGIDNEYLSLRLICMNPAVMFEGLKTSRCIILASGTLSPLVSLHSELGTEFKLKANLDHIILKERVWVGMLTSQPDGKPLVCTNRETNEVSTQDALGQTVLWASRVTPNGILCFIPSYNLLDKLVQRWGVTGIWKKLQDLKYVFRENKNVKDHNDTMEDYYKYVSSDKGALLFAVYRGKVSEGMDFKDKQARLVITVGIPYPNMYDMALKQKMNYNDKFMRDKNLLSGKDWLRVQAYRALNQAVGRCIRHANDWGAVLLIDYRFRNEFDTEYLSKWVKSFLNKNFYTYEDLVNGTDTLEDFMQRMTLSDNEDL